MNNTPIPADPLKGQDTPEWTATFTLDRQIAAARKGMSAARWKQLCAEFDAPPMKEARHG